MPHRQRSDSRNPEQRYEQGNHCGKGRRGALRPPGGVSTPQPTISRHSDGILRQGQAGYIGESISQLVRRSPSLPRSRADDSQEHSLQAADSARQSGTPSLPLDGPILSS